jgi:hypothetical protein
MNAIAFPSLDTPVFDSEHHRRDRTEQSSLTVQLAKEREGKRSLLDEAGDLDVQGFAPVARGPATHIGSMAAQRATRRLLAERGWSAGRDACTPDGRRFRIVSLGLFPLANRESVQIAGRLLGDDGTIAGPQVRMFLALNQLVALETIPGP